MTLISLLLTALLGGDPCAPSVGPPLVEVDPRTMEITVSRSYAIPWAVCAQEKGGKPPLFRITAKDGAGRHVLLEEPVELRDSLREGTRSVSTRASGCDRKAPNRRDDGAALRGPVGSRVWYNRRTIEVELIAEGPFAPLAFKTRTEVHCRACSDDDTISFSYYMNDFDENTVRMHLSVDKARYECARGGGRLMLRRFWTEPGAEAWAPLRPYEVVDNLHERLKVEGDKMVYEVIEPAARFCRAGKSHLFELVGIDEYSTIVRRNYGPSDAIHRSGIEFLRCKE